MKAFNFLKRPGIIITAVAVISMIAGAGTMAALAGNTSLSGAAGSNNSTKSSRSATKNESTKDSKSLQTQIRILEADIRKKEAAIKKLEAKKRKQDAAIKKNEVSAKKQELTLRKQVLKDKSDRRISKTIAKKDKKSKKKGSQTNTSASSTGLRRYTQYDFSRISATGAINVVFSQGESDGFVEVHGDTKALECIRLAYNGGNLEIGYTKNPGQLSTRTIVYITNPKLEGIKFSGATSITVQGPLKTDKLDVEVSGASDINISHVTGQILNISASGASVVQILSSDMHTINATASGASDIKLKGVCANTVNSTATAASIVSAIGRCNYKKSKHSAAGMVKDQGLIIENNPVDCTGNSQKKKTMPRKP